MATRETEPGTVPVNGEALDATTPLPRAGGAEPRPSSDGAPRGPWNDVKRTLREAASWHTLNDTPYGLVPVLLLALEGIARGFDSSIFGLVLPDVIRDLDLDVRGVLTALNLLGLVLIFATVGIGYLLDRVKRVPWLAGGALLSGAFSFFTTMARSTLPLGIFRVGDAVADRAATVPRFSLLNDYYPVHTRGKVFAMVGTLQRIGVLAAPLAIGYLAFRTNWRVPFLVTGPILLVVGILILVVLREPVRGYMERKALGEDEQIANTAEAPPSFGAAWRTIWGIRTIRRLFISDIAVGIGSRVTAFIFPLYLFDAYGLDVLGRGRVGVVSAIGAVFGGFLGGGIVDSLVRRRPQRVLIFSGAIGLVASFSLFAIAAQPPLWFLVVIFGVFGFAFALLGPARGVFYGLILPAHVRTLGGAIFVLADIPAVILFQLFIVRIPEWGLTGVLAASAPFFIVGAIIEFTAASFFERDMRSAIASQRASEEYRRTREAGATKLLVSRDVDVEYDGVQVLFGVDFDVEDGDIIALLGTNGAGKSTLLKAISGIQEASGGAIVFDGRDITHVPPYEIAGRGVVHMPGGRGVFPGLTVRENLMLAGWLNRPASEDPGSNGATETDGGDEVVSGVPTAKVTHSDIEEVLELFPGLEGRLEARAGTLSGGEQQMVALAQAFLQRPRLLMIDELSLGLAPTIVQELLESVRRIHERGVTIIVVEQSVNVALTIAERAIFMEKGEVKFFGKTKDLLRRPDILRAVYVKGTGALSAAPTGVKGERERRRGVLEEARPVLEVQNISKSFGGVRAVRDVSFDLREGEILGLIGPNGAGKTTIFDLISGHVPLDSGKVIYDGVDVTHMGPDQRAKLQLIRRFQDARLFPSLSVYETVLVALERQNEVRNMFLTALQLPQVRASERRLRRRADHLIDLLELAAFRDKFVKELSTGLRRITDLACVLAAEPKVLLLDEPSSGIAQAEAEGLAPLLRRVRHETGCSILIIEHDMPLISSISDELIALDQGAVVMRDTPDVVLNDLHVIESYLGTSEQVIRRSGVVEE